MADLTGGAGRDPGPTVSHSRRSDSHDQPRRNWRTCSDPPRLREPAQAASRPIPLRASVLRRLRGDARGAARLRRLDQPVPSRLIGGKVFAGLDNYTRPYRPGFLEGLRRRAHPARSGADHARPRWSSRSFSTAGAPTVARPTSAHLPAVCRARCRRDPHVGYLTVATSARSDRRSEAVGLEAPNFFSEQNMLGAIMNVVTWSFVGYNMVIMYSALRVIPLSSTKLPRSTAHPSSESPGASRSP